MKFLKGFTLIELLVVVGIVAALSTVIVITLNPAELLKQARDATRLSDLQTLRKAFAFIEAQGGTLTPADPNKCATEAQKTIFVSVPIENNLTDPLPAPPLGGWAWGQVGQATLRNLDASGWIPIDIQESATKVVPPISVLPVDPVNTFASGLYYSYVCGSFEFTAAMESQKYLVAAAQSDGGTQDARVEVGTKVGITPQLPTPTAPVPAPSVTGITPSVGTNNGTVSITSVGGANFQSGATVKLEKTGQGDIVGGGFVVADSTTINGGTFDLTGVATGLWNVIVTNPDAQTGTLNGGFTVNPAPVPPPSVSGITPASGFNNGLVSGVDVSGANFQSGATVKLTRSGVDIQGAGFTFGGANSLTGGSFDLNGAAAGQWDVVVTNPDAQSGTFAGGFTVNVPVPTISGINPSSGVNNGTIAITSITGSNFQSGASVKLTQSGQADILGSGFTVANNTTINGGTFDLTGAVTGAWDVVVTNPGGSPGTYAGGFTINPPAAGIMLDAVSSAKTATDAMSLTWQHTVSSAANRLLVVGISMSGGSAPVTSVTYGGVALTKKGSRLESNGRRVELWYRVGPAAGTNDIVVSVSAAVSIIGGVTSWSGVNQTTPLGTFASFATSGGTVHTVNISSNAGEVVQDIVASSVAFSAPGAGQTMRWSDTATNVKGGGSTTAGPTTQMSWTTSVSVAVAIAAVVILPN